MHNPSMHSLRTAINET